MPITLRTRGSFENTRQVLLRLPREIRTRVAEPSLLAAAQTWADYTRTLAPVGTGLLTSLIRGTVGYPRFKPSAFLTLGTPYAHIFRHTQYDFLAESLFIARRPMQIAFVREFNRQLPRVLERLNRRNRR